MVVYNLGFYNVEESRPDPRTHREMRALLQGGAIGGGPLDALGMCELIGNTCPKVDGYLRIRSHKTPGRSNLGCYVRKDLYASHLWVQQALTWVRPRDPEHRKHPARAILVVTLKDGTLLVVNHFPELPRPHFPQPELLVAARREYKDALIGILAPSQGAAIVLGDENAGPDDGLLEMIAEQADLEWHGRRVDKVATHKAEFIKVEYLREVDGVTKGSDHGHALSARVRVVAPA